MDISLINYHYDELIKTLITIASPADRQIEIMGFGNVGDDMMIDFESHYTGVRQEFIDYCKFTNEEIKVLEDFDEYLNEIIQGNEVNLFVVNEELFRNIKWENVRSKAHKVLKHLKKDNLTLLITREIIGEQGTIIEFTKTELMTIIPGKLEDGDDI